MKALKIFTVSYGGIRIKVRLLPTIADVHREYIDGTPRRDSKIVHAFFAPTHRADAKHVGTIALPLDGLLAELVPHEVTHAVMHKMRSVHCADDEALATAVGMLSARIHKKLGVSA